MKYREDFCCNSSSSSFIARIDGKYFNKNEEGFREYFNDLMIGDEDSSFSIIMSEDEVADAVALMQGFENAAEVDESEYDDEKRWYKERIEKIRKSCIDWEKDFLIIGNLSYNQYIPDSFDVIYEEY